MRKLLVMFLIILALLTMAQECQTGTEDGDLKDPFVGGTEGLQISFEDGRPPEFVSDGGAWPFYIDVVLKNLGESYVEGSDVKITISGPNPSDFGVSSSALIKDGIAEDIYELKKEEGRIIEPAEVYVTFGEFNFEDILEADFPFNIRADICYKYETKAKTNGCVLKDPTASEETAYCNVREAKIVYNSGAPIQIANFEESPAGSDKIKYVFTIKHVGNGRFFSPEVKCGDDKRSENKVHFEIDSRVADLNCQGVSGGGKAGEVYLGRDGEADVTCIQQFRSENDFIDRITVDITYDYLQIKEIPFLVKAESNT